MGYQDKRVKIYNRMFRDAENSFYMLKFYYSEITDLLRTKADDFHKYTDELVEEHKKLKRPFDKEYWLKHFDVYAEYYPHLYNNSFVVTACALFEFQIKKICALIKEEHRLPIGWDAMEKASIPTKAKRFLKFAGVELGDDPTDPLQLGILTVMFGGKSLSAEELWQELEDYFRVRNCIAHHNGLIQRMRYPERITKYASRKGISRNNKGQVELSLSQDFNKEVCDIMKQFFSKVTSAYYCAPLPE